MFPKIYVEITNICNLNCSFCHGTVRPKRFMTREEFARIAPELRKHTEYVYLHLMGEPLCHKELGEIIDTAAENGLRVAITTNGTLLAGRKDELLSRADKIYKISISLHSLEANGEKSASGANDISATNPEKTANNSAITATRDGVLRKNDNLSDSVETYSAFTSLSHEEYCSNAFAFAKEAGERGIIAVLRLWNLPFLTPDTDESSLADASPQNRVLLDKMRQFFPSDRQKNRSGLKIGKSVYLEWGERFDWPDADLGEGSECGFCYGLHDHVGILCDGTVVPCCLDADGNIPLGNVFTSSLDEILSSPRAKAISEGFAHGRKVEPLCRKCGYSKRFL